MTAKKKPAAKKKTPAKTRAKVKKAEVVKPSADPVVKAKSANIPDKQPATKPAEAKKTEGEGTDKAETKKKTGRPTKYTPALGEKICAHIIEGLSMRKVCELDGMPAPGTVFTWLAGNAEFQDQYTRAKEIQAEQMAEEMLDIADDGRNDVGVDGDGDGKEFINHDVISRSRLRVETRKWLMGKMKPKKYGDKVTHANDPDNPMPTGAQTVILMPAKNPPESARKKG